QSGEDAGFVVHDQNQLGHASGLPRRSIAGQPAAGLRPGSREDRAAAGDGEDRREEIARRKVQPPPRNAKPPLRNAPPRSRNVPRERFCLPRRRIARFLALAGENTTYITGKSSLNS